MAASPFELTQSAVSRTLDELSALLTVTPLFPFVSFPFVYWFPQNLRGVFWL